MVMVAVRNDISITRVLNDISCIVNIYPIRVVYPSWSLAAARALSS